MVTLRLELNVRNYLPEDFKNRTDAEIIINAINGVISLWTQQKNGMEEPQRRILYKLWDHFEKSLSEDKNITSIVLEDQWVALIRTAFKEVRFSPDRLTANIEYLVTEAN